jgi:hypothetical protein
VIENDGWRFMRQKGSHAHHCSSSEAGRCDNREFQQFLSVAKGSVGEVRSQLYVALDAGFVTQEQFNRADKLAHDITHMVGAFIVYLRKSKLRGLNNILKQAGLK